jgi:SAM-dependent methyltransferase
MKPFEIVYLCLEPFLPPLYKIVRQRLTKITKCRGNALDVLDIGGRKSNYTIGLPASITITDLPRESSVQKELMLGINDEVMKNVYKRRSNIKNIIYDDMTKSSLPDCSFDLLVSIEVLEHVEEDAQFIKHAHRVLKPGGIFLMTTPNGDYVPNTNPDHKRHYTREQLHGLLSNQFEKVELEYAIQDGVFHRKGLKSWSVRHPLETLSSMASNVINLIQSSGNAIKNRSKGTRHLIAVAHKSMET